MTKSELRTHFKEIMHRHSVDVVSLSLSQAKLVQNVFEFLKLYSGIWGTFQPLSQEVSLLGVVAARKDIRWVYPRMQGASLEFCLPELWEKANFGVLQPALGCEKVELEQIQGLLVPGLVFDRNGNRLGRGRGFYDQALESFGGIKVGVGYSWQIFEAEIPTESHDVKMNWIITEDSIVKIEDTEIR